MRGGQARGGHSSGSPTASTVAAFSASTVPSVHPYILLNWTDKLRDVSTMAHELGHGIHQYLSRKQTRHCSRGNGA